MSFRQLIAAWQSSVPCSSTHSRETLWYPLLYFVCCLQQIIFLQAHDGPVRSMVWSHADNWLLSSDHGGFIKYWQSNMNNVKMYEAHKEPIRGLRLESLVPGAQQNGQFLAVLVGIVELIKLLIELALVQKMNNVLSSSGCREISSKFTKRYR